MSARDVVNVVEATPTTSNDVTDFAPPAAKRQQPKQRPKFGGKARMAPQQHRYRPYFKQERTTVLSGKPLSTWFQVYTSNNTNLYADAFYNLVTAADSYIGRNLTKHQVEYVMCIAMLNRMVQTGVKEGYFCEDTAESLRIPARTILLPDLLCKYIEAVGLVEMDGINIVPYVATYQELHDMPELYLDPAALLTAAGRAIPDNYWKVDFAWIADYNIAISRVARLRLGVRTVAESTQGRSEMLVGYSMLGELTIPKAPKNLAQTEFDLGASYKFRCYDNIRTWPAPDNTVIAQRYLSGALTVEGFVASQLSEALVMRLYSATH